MMSDEWIDELPDTLKSGPIIALFDKTKPPVNEDDVFCPHFWELKYANGCYYDCQWCFLNGTYHFNPDMKDRPSHKDPDKIRAQLDAILTAAGKAKTPIMLDAGEVSDAMVFPNLLLSDVIPVFKAHAKEGHRLLLLTKSADKTFINRANGQNVITFAWSINAVRVADIYERLAPTPLERLGAARHAMDVGYPVRLRLDPMVPIDGWKEAYTHIIQAIMRIAPNAEVITLGTLRCLKNNDIMSEKLGKDTSWKRYLTENSSWGRRPPQELCAEMYTHAIKELRKYGYKGIITLCKETLGVWKILKDRNVIDYTPGDVICNCVLTSESTKGRDSSCKQQRIDETQDGRKDAGNNAPNADTQHHPEQTSATPVDAASTNTVPTKRKTGKPKKKRKAA